jgi:hypothetical protein
VNFQLLWGTDHAFKGFIFLNHSQKVRVAGSERIPIVR